jgi:DNA-binding CsgD family transcriptional regulator
MAVALTSSPTARPRAQSTVPRQTAVPAVPARDLLAMLDAKDLQALIDAAFRVLQRVVPCDFTSAFYRTSQKGLLKERDSRGIVYTPAFMQRAIALNPAIPLALANPGVRILTTRKAIAGPDSVIRASPFYREIMQPQGWRHAVALCFWGEPAGNLPVFVLSVYRIEGRADFGRADVTHLEGIYPFIACAVNRLHEREKAKSVRDGVAITGRDGNRGLAVVDANLHLVEANALGRRLAGAWGTVSPAKRRRDKAPAWMLPPQLASECRAMRLEWESSLSANPDAHALRRRRKIVHPTLEALSASISMVCRNTNGLSEPTFVLEFERRAPRTSVTMRLDQPVLQMLTEAQQAVAVVLIEGVSNQEIADRLAKSVDAVKFLLHGIYQKTGVSGRAALIARLRA